MMPLDEILKDKRSVAVVDNFWGDSGKGKLIDYLLSKGDYRMVIRFNGGNNAGHTIKVGNVELVSHIVPSIQFNPEVKGVIGNGCVIDLESLFKEIDDLEQNGIMVKDRLYLSGSANIITGEHVKEDLKNSKVGTTGRGIGPAYSDKVSRTGIRINDLFDMTLLKDEHKEFYDYFIGSGLINRLDEIYHMAADTQTMITKAYDKGEKILFEGAQGALLDIDHGTYPFTTSSSTTIGGAVTGSGIPPNKLDAVIGIVKAYTTRVGNGPFPSEFGGKESEEYCKKGIKHDMFNEAVEYLGLDKSYSLLSLQEKKLKKKEVVGFIKQNREKVIELANSSDLFKRGIGLRLFTLEYGATTSRPRRTGALDLLALKKISSINGKDIFITRLDCLDAVESIPICTGYNYTGRFSQVDEHILRNNTIIDFYPGEARVLQSCEPVLESLEGWMQPTSNIREYAKLPAKAKEYLKRIEEFTGTRICGISVGPEREQTIVR